MTKRSKKRKRRDKGAEKKRQALVPGPSAPARLSFKGRTRSGDQAVLETDFAQGARVPFDPAHDDPEVIQERLDACTRPSNVGKSN